MARLFRIRVLTFALLLYGALVLNIGLSQGEGFFQHYLTLKHSKEKLQVAMDDLEAENQALDEEIMRLRQSPSYVEKVMRDKYHIRKDNEVIVFFDD